MFDKIPLDKKIWVLSKLSKKYEMKSSFDFIFQKGLFGKLLGASYLALDVLVPDQVDNAFKNEMKKCNNKITKEWFKENCTSSKISDHWTCFYKDGIVVGAHFKDSWSESHYQTKSLNTETVRNDLYKKSNIIHISPSFLFDFRKENIPINEAITPIKKSNSNKVIKDKKINVFVGPSGSGKTSCALSNCKDNEKVVITSGNEGLYCLEEIINTFNPDVLILDDIEYSILKSSNLLISAIDRIKITNIKLFITIMVDESFVFKRGSLYLPGLRPGRVDQILYFESMSSKERETFLNKENIEFDDISKSEGFTYAYMLELLKLIKEENKTYNEATDYLSLFIPIIKKEKVKDGIS